MSIRMIVALVAIGFSVEASAAERVESIGRDWQAARLRRLGVSAASASSHFGDAAVYGPERASDGQRGSKWVAADQPSPEQPQWLTLELSGSQPVTAVAVFGEAIGNDGIQDAQIQVAGAAPGEFTSVAAIAAATSDSWLATFAPVRTTAVRLLVTRSGGPSTHTDVYEVEVFGPPLAPAEWQSYAAERLAGCQSRWQHFLAEAGKAGYGGDASPLGLARVATTLEGEQRTLANQLPQWESLDEAGRQELVTQLERLEVRIQRLAAGLAQGGSDGPQRVRELRVARQTARRLSASDDVVASRDGSQLRLTNRHVSLALDEATGLWDATWLGPTDAALRRVGFSVCADDKIFGVQPTPVTMRPFTDGLGSGWEVQQRWGEDVVVERCLRVYRGQAAIVVAAQITNGSDTEVELGTTRLLDVRLGKAGWWCLGGVLQAPASVAYPSVFPCRPTPELDSTGGADVSYGGSGVLALASREAAGGLALGFLSTRAGTPAVAAWFRAWQGGTGLDASLSMDGRTLQPGQTLTLDLAWLSVEEDGFAALERYGDAAAAHSIPPARSGANALWCSWYPLRMTINEEIVLAHAQIAAEHFQPLGLDVIQLDHGWQQGDICGDWEPNARFPHGLAWLAEQLRSRHGLKLGLWIAPTQVAVTSRLFHEHPEWMATGPDGQPLKTGRWFWSPNPEMTVLDAGKPEVQEWIAATFARLTAAGASYYKIDFIAGSPALRQALEAIRRGAGPDAWIRYCQTPPLLSAGVASSAYIGDDTGDAGLPNWMHLERINAPLLAASYWVNDRLYHREVCDMSVGMTASIEEARFKLSLMTMAGCSISFSDDFRPLDLPRIRLMQQCLPPGNPPARPLDLFASERPSLWHMRCRRDSESWEAVGVFNFSDDAAERTIELKDLGLPADAEVVAFEFWEEKLLGVCRDRVTLTLAPHTARIALIHPRPTRPQVIATNMHVLGGYHELSRRTWDATAQRLSGRYQRVPGLAGKGFVFVPDGFRPRLDGAVANGPVRLREAGGNLWVHEIEFRERQVDWSVEFERVGS